MRVEIKGDDEGSVPDLLFRVAQEKRGEIDMKANKKHVAPMPEKKHSDETKCDEAHAFRAMDGASYRSVVELANALDTMSDDTFYYHVTEQKNDFCSWLKEVFHEEALADKMLRARTKDRHQIVMLKHLLEKK